MLISQTNCTARLRALSHASIVSWPTITLPSVCTTLRNFIQIGPPSPENNDVMSIVNMADLSYLGFYGSNNGFFRKSNYKTYRSSIETIALNCLVFEKNRVFVFWRQTDRQTDEQMDSTDALSRSRCRKRRRRLNKNLAVANRSRVSCAHNRLRASIGLNITP